MAVAPVAAEGLAASPSGAVCGSPAWPNPMAHKNAAPPHANTLAIRFCMPGLPLTVTLGPSTGTTVSHHAERPNPALLRFYCSPWSTQNLLACSTTSLASVMQRPLPRHVASTRHTALPAPFPPTYCHRPRSAHSARALTPAWGFPALPPNPAVTYSQQENDPTLRSLAYGP